MDYNEIQVLIEKYLNGQATEAERMIVDTWYNSFDPLPGLTSELSKDQINDIQAKEFSALLSKITVVKE